MKTLVFLLMGGVLGSLAPGGGKQDADPCAYFYDSLATVPHDTLTVSSGEGVWIWHDQSYKGCEVRFVTNDSLRAGYQVPDFEATEGSEMYRLGWRYTEGILADGPGSGVFGIERGSVECLVVWNQSAWIDDDGEFQQSDVLEMTIQCRARPWDPRQAAL
jgi:hypothetical protein